MRETLERIKAVAEAERRLTTGLDVESLVDRPRWSSLSRPKGETP